MHLATSLALAADTDAQGFWASAAFAATAVVVIAYALVFLGALFSVLGSRLGGGMKLVWIVFAFCAPFLGPLLWFLVGRRASEQTRL